MTQSTHDTASQALFHAKGQHIFVLVTLLSCLILQRFGLPAGTGTEASVAVPIVAVMAFWYLWTGVLAIDRLRFAIMLSLVAVALVAINVKVNVPIAMVTKISMGSLLYWLFITSFAVLRFSRPMDERVFFNTLVGCLAFIAFSGIVAFLAQFVGLQLFSFRGFLPVDFSMEPYYNVVIPLGGTSLHKANGFFLVEPSTFSQFMALGLVAEWLIRRRTAYIALFLFALFCSASGTGWLIVGAFVLYNACVKGGRGLAVAVIFSCVCLLGFFVVNLIFPQVTDSLTSRFGEFNEQGSSGNQRFVTPLLVLQRVLQVAPWAFFTGIGPGGADALAGITYEYGMNTPIKILLEYGIFGLISYMLLILCNVRTSRQNSVLIPAFVLLLFAGGNEHFPPILFPVLLITTVLNGASDDEADTAASIASPGAGRLRSPPLQHAA